MENNLLADIARCLYEVDRKPMMEFFLEQGFSPGSEPRVKFLVHAVAHRKKYLRLLKECHCENRQDLVARLLELASEDIKDDNLFAKLLSTTDDIAELAAAELVQAGEEAVARGIAHHEFSDRFWILAVQHYIGDQTQEYALMKSGLNKYLEAYSQVLEGDPGARIAKLCVDVQEDDVQRMLKVVEKYIPDGCMPNSDTAVENDPNARLVPIRPSRFYFPKGINPACRLYWTNLFDLYERIVYNERAPLREWSVAIVLFCRLCEQADAKPFTGKQQTQLPKLETTT